MRRALRPAVLAGTTVALVATGGVIAYAGWSSGTDSESFTVYAATIPRVPAPRAYVRAATAVPSSGAVFPSPSPDGTEIIVRPAPVPRPRIGWKPVRLAADVPVHRYVVTRHLGPVTEVVCDQAATVVLRCVDRTAPPGYRMTYTVAATYGGHWVGEDSVPSPAITMPGVAVPVTVNGVAVLPGPDGEPVVPAAGRSSAPVTAPARPSPSSPGSAPVSPSVEPSEDDDSGTGVVVPPSPGGVSIPSGMTEAPDEPSPSRSGTPTVQPGNGPPPNVPGPPAGVPGPPPNIP